MDDYPSQKRIAAWITGWTLFGFLLVIAVTAGVLLWRYVIAAPAGKVQARQQIQSGNYRIAAYNHFFDLCASVQTKEATIAALQQELATRPPESRIEQINASITANVAGRADDINQYNADAEKDYTLAQFRASKLPFQLDPRTKETRCALP